MNNVQEILYSFISRLDENGSMILFDVGITDTEENKAPVFQKIYNGGKTKVTVLESYIMLTVSDEEEIINEMEHWLEQYGEERVAAISEMKDYHLMIALFSSDADDSEMCTFHNPIFWDIGRNNEMKLLFEIDNVLMSDASEQIFGV